MMDVEKTTNAGRRRMAVGTTRLAPMRMGRTALAIGLSILIASLGAAPEGWR